MQSYEPDGSFTSTITIFEEEHAMKLARSIDALLKDYAQKLAERIEGFGSHPGSFYRSDI
jgi:hypothetical protein